GRSVRPFLLGGSALSNVSYVTIPADAAHPDGAMVLANLLLDPRLQAIQASPRVLGTPTVLDRARLSADDRERLDTLTRSPFLLDDLGRPLAELPAARVGEIEARWEREI